MFTINELQAIITALETDLEFQTHVSRRTNSPLYQAKSFTQSLIMKVHEMAEREYKRIQAEEAKKREEISKRASEYHRIQHMLYIYDIRQVCYFIFV